MMHKAPDDSKRSDGPRFSLRTLLIAISIAAACLAIVGSVNLRSIRRQMELERLAKTDKATLDAIVKSVESIRAKLGRVPRDEAELELLLGGKMPVVHDQGHPTPIRYYRRTDTHYVLAYTLWGTDDWIYDSNKPNAGWVQRYF